MAAASTILPIEGSRLLAAEKSSAKAEKPDKGSEDYASNPVHG